MVYCVIEKRIAHKVAGEMSETGCFIIPSISGFLAMTMHIRSPGIYSRQKIILIYYFY